MIPANVIEKLLAKDESFTRVSLPSNSLYKSSADETTAELCNALKDNPYCVEVDLSDCGISGTGAESIANLIADNAVIKKLNLANNKIDSAGQEKIFVALKTNKTLEELKLLGNFAPGEGCLTTLVETFEYNTSLLNIIWRLESRQSFKINQQITRNKEIQRRLAAGKSVDDVDPNIRRETEKRILEERAAGLPKFVAPEVEAEPTEAPPATGGPYPLKVLKAKLLPSDVDSNKKEEYLSDDEFVEVFKTSKEQFASSPTWKRKQLKKDAGLF
mmetsp:Transcript_14325/g.22532  ORF Transcript_14325/g.22532 Transcript_14325/m.22532 type:complete len:273 (+) Transcript_14325:16-834(+)